MNIKGKLALTLFFCSTLLYAHETSFEQVPVKSKDRILCTTLSQGQYARFDHCRNGEVMTGIRSLDPLMVYCTTLLANCRNSRDSSDTQKRGTPKED